MLKDVVVKENHVVIALWRGERVTSSLATVLNMALFPHHDNVLENKDVGDVALDNNSNGSMVKPNSLSFRGRKVECRICCSSKGVNMVASIKLRVRPDMRINIKR